MTFLFISDLDSTLLHEGIMPDETALALKGIIERNIHFTVATARGYKSTVSVFQYGLPKLPIIALNGSVIIEAGGSVMNIISMDNWDIHSIIIMLKPYDVDVCRLQTSGTNDQVVVPERMNEFTQWSIEDGSYFKDQDIVTCNSLKKGMAVVRLVICGNFDTLDLIEKKINSINKNVVITKFVSDTYLNDGWLEISPRLAAKGYAVQRLASDIKIPLKNVVFYGDAMNDIDAMEIAGQAIAVSSANEEVIKIADRIIGDPASSSVPTDILELVEQQKH